MKLRKILTALLIAAAFAPAAFAVNAYAAENTDPTSIAVILYGEDEASGIKTIVISADREINDNISVAVPLNLNGYRLVINGDLVQSADINVGSGELIVTGNYYQSKGTLSFEEGGKLTVQGNFNHTKAVDVTGGTMTVEGEYYQTDGKLTIGSGKLTVGGDYLNAYKNSVNDDGSTYFTASNGTLNMSEDNGYFLVGGDMNFSSTSNNASTANYIVAGTLELKGNFVQGSDYSSSNCFDAKGTHKVILSGEKQVIKFGSPKNSGFNILTDTNCPDAEITGRIASLGSDVTIGKFEQYQTLDLNGKTMTVTGDVDSHGTVSLNAGKLSVGGDYVQDSGRLEIQDGRMEVAKDFRFQYKNGYNEDGTVKTYTGSNASLNMTNDSGYLLVSGDMYFYSTNNNAETANCITAGTLELKGDFTQGQAYNCFDAKGTHKVIFSGSDVQNITFASPNSSGFNILTYTPNYNTNIKGRISKINKNVAVGNFEQYGELNLKSYSLKVRGDLKAEGTIYVNSGTLNVIGNYIHEAGKLKVQTGTVKVGKDLRFQYQKKDSDGTVSYSGSDASLNMADDKGYMLVNGNMYFYSTQNNASTANYIVAGTLELKGNFEQGQAYNCFDAKGTHKLILSGKKQVIKFGSPKNSGFNILTNTNNSDAEIHGRISSLGSDVTVGSFEQYQTLDLKGKTMNVTKDMDAHGTIYLDAGNLNVGGNYVQDSGKLKAQDGKMKVDGDFRFQYKNGTDADGNINYTGSNASLNMANDKGYILVNGDMYFYSTQNNASTANYIVAGTLELKGDFTQGQAYNCFDAKGTHKLILSGKKQVIKFGSPSNSGFNILTDTNNADAELHCRISSLGSDVTVGSFEQYQTLDLKGKTMNVTKDMDAHGTIYLDAGNLNVGGNYVHDSGKLKVQDGKMKVGGDFRFQYKNGTNADGNINYTGSNASLNMANDKGYILVNGNMYFYSTQNNASTANYIVAGTLELKGNFEQGQAYNCFDAKGTHKLILSGKKQVIKFSSPSNSGFNILTDTNNSDAEIHGRISSLGSDVTVGSFEQYQKLDLNGKTLTVAGDMDPHGTVKLNNGKLLVGGNYVQDSGRLEIQDGRMEVAKDFRFQYKNSYNEDGTVKTYTGSTASLNMTNDNGYLCVGGDMYFYSTQNNASTANYIVAGTLELKGDFTQGQAYNCFEAKGTHKLILSGEKQVIKFGSPSNSGFNILTDTNNADAELHCRISSLGSDVTVGSFEQYQKLDLNGKTLTVAGDMDPHGTVKLNNGKLLVGGNYVQDSGRLEIGSGRMEVAKDFRFQYKQSVNEDGTINYTGSNAVLNMTDARGYLLVGGNMCMFSTQNNAETANYITAGTIELKGDFVQGQAYNCFVAKGSHKVIFSGTEEQYASFDSPKNSCFNIVDISRNPKASQVALAPHRVLITEPELVNLSVLSTEHAFIGDTVALIAVAAGGEGDYTYTYMYKKHSSETWNYIGSKNGSNICVSFLTPGKAVDYDIMVIVTDSKGAVVSQTLTLEVREKLVNTSTVSSDKIVVDQPITISGSSTGGFKPVKYTFAFKKSTNSSWTAIGSKYISGNTATFTPSSDVDYDIKITATDAYGHAVEKIINIYSQTVLRNTSTVSAESIKLGDTITLNGSATGGTGDYTYALMYKKSKNSVWLKIGTKYGTASSGSFKPTAATDYDIMINIKDSSGKIVYKTFKLSVTK